MTWNEPLINNDSIGGSLADIGRLKVMIENKLLSANAGETFVIGSDYAPHSEYVLRFFVMADNFGVN